VSALSVTPSGLYFLARSPRLILALMPLAQPVIRHAGFGALFLAFVIDACVLTAGGRDRESVLQPFAAGAVKTSGRAHRAC